MKAARIHRFGAPDVVVVEEVPRPAPGAGELLIRVAASGVGPWDALIREGKSKVSPPLPLTLGSDLSGVVEETGPSASEFKKGDEIYGVTNPQFCGANAQYAVTHANMVALRPSRLSYVEAASAPVIAVTAWQMLFECGNAKPNQTVMILGAAGNVGAYAVQLAVNVGLQVIGVVVSKDIEYVKALGSQTIVNHQAGKFENAVRHVDLILDTVGGETRERSYSVLKSGGVLVSVVSTDPIPERPDARSVFFYAEVTTERLNGIARLFCSGQLTPQVGTLLPLNDVRTAHEMLAGALRDVHGNLLNEPDFTSFAWRAPRTAERTRPPTAALSPAVRAFNSVAVSIVFVVMSCGSCDGKTWEAKRMAIRFPSMPV